MSRGTAATRRWPAWGAAALVLAAGLVAVLSARAATAATASAPAAAPVDQAWLDRTYGADGLAAISGATGSGAVDAEGRAYVVSASPTPVLRRLTPAGALDTTFAGGALTLPFATGETLVHPDRAGTVTVLRRGEHGVTLLRYTASGLPDTGFHGIGAVSLLTDVALRWPAQVIDRPGGILLLGSASDGGTSYLVALTDAGTLDTTWASERDTPGILPVPQGIRAIASDGGTVVAVRGGGSLVRYAADGTLDQSFGAVPLRGRFTGVSVFDGAYYLTGPSGLRRVLASAEFDESFQADATCDPAFAVGHIYVACDGAVTRFTGSGQLDTAYGDGGRLAVPGALLGVQPNGRLLFAVGSPTDAVLRLRSTADGVPVAGAFVPLPAARLLDTRDGTGALAGPVPAAGLLDLRIAGRGGVPESGAGAVVLTVTVVDPVAAGFMTVYPTGEPAPATSNVNFVAGQTIANLVTVPLGDDGSVSLRSGSAGPVHLLADVAGYFRAGRAIEPGAFVALPAARVLDTRSGSGPVPAAGDVHVAIAGQGGVPASGAGAVVLTVTVAAPAAPGAISAAGPILRFARGQTVSSLITLPIGPDGAVSLHNGSAGTLELVVDVAGYHLAGAAAEPGTFMPLTPTRLPATPGPVPPLEDLTVAVAGHGVPISASAVMLTATVAGPGASGFITVYPAGTVAPPASNLNFAAGAAIGNAVVVPLGAAGSVSLRNASSGAAHLAVDVVGYFV